jgi:hypothetical protein
MNYYSDSEFIEKLNSMNIMKNQDKLYYFEELDNPNRLYQISYFYIEYNENLMQELQKIDCFKKANMGIGDGLYNKQSWYLVPTNNINKPYVFMFWFSIMTAYQNQCNFELQFQL